jgi:hypothetical protein
MAITYATLDGERRDENELATALKELEHLHHLEKYNQDSTQATMFLRSEFKDTYSKFTNERHLFNLLYITFPLKFALDILWLPQSLVDIQYAQV